MATWTMKMGDLRGRGFCMGYDVISLTHQYRYIPVGLDFGAENILGVCKTTDVVRKSRALNIRNACTW